MAIYRPLLAITLGDPAGIGPEIVVKALADPALYRLCRPLLVGDAAGLVDPCTGEGIHHAVVSARLAAQALERHLTTPDSAPLSAYETLVDTTLMPEIQRAKAFGRLFDLSPRICIGALKRSSGLWNVACRLCRGETTYVAEGKRLGPLEFILDRMARQPYKPIRKVASVRMR